MSARTTASKLENRLFFAFCLITALMPLLSINIPRSFAFMPGISATIIFAVHYFTAKPKPALSQKTAILIATMLCVLTLSLLWAQYFDASKDKVFKLLAFLPPQILLFSLIACADKEALTPLKKLLPISFFIASALLIFEIRNSGFVHNILRGEDISVFTDPDEFNRGTVALSLYAFPIFALLSLQLKKWVAACLAFLPIIGTSMISQSQASLMCMLVAGIFVLLFPYGHKRAVPTLKFVIILLMLVTPFIITPIYENFAQTLQDIPILARGYAGHRLEIWDYVSRYALQEPWIGHGIQAARDITDFDSKNIFHNGSEILHPHNFVVQIWLELGLLGIIVLSTLTYAFFTILEKNFSQEQQKIILPTAMATLSIACVSYGLWQGAWLGLIFHIAAVTLITTKIANDKQT